MPHMQVNSDKLMSEQECHKLLETIKNSAAENANTYYAIFYTMSMTGLRVSEVCDLRWSDVNLTAKTLIVRHGKGDKKRNVNFTNNLKQVLKSLQGRDQGLVFKSRTGGFTRMAIHNLLKKYLAEANLRENISCHSFRHYYAVYLLNHGASLALVQNQLGHTNVVTTSCYLQYTKDYSDKLESILG